MQAKTAINRLHLDSLLRTVAHLRRATQLSLAFDVEAMAAPTAIESTDTVSRTRLQWTDNVNLASETIIKG